MGFLAKGVRIVRMKVCETKRFSKFKENASILNHPTDTQEQFNRLLNRNVYKFIKESVYSVSTMNMFPYLSNFI